ncbi:hypothetical protein EXIGLDRAFT_716195 [Exidia glandulosa HHB12029]|uniref:CCHC-type domain-containing protein n=1 Tax=Exidia glandulosa HHB12029 TaxID=1314781 RepID=A0A165QXA1_EXIGL|nr:hypothetical protein EXIGLDRAFT_716195 [Exidia glandulosa HHB12029]
MLSVMKPAPPPDFIDLTGDLELSEVIVISDGDDDDDNNKQPASSKKRRKKKKNRDADSQPMVNGTPVVKPDTRTQRGRGEGDRADGQSSRKRDRRERRQSRSRSRSPSRHKRQRSDSPERRADRKREPSRERRRSPTPFVVDTTATILPNLDLDAPSLTVRDDGLILPAHVLVLKEGEEPEPVDRAMTPMSDSSFIEVLDLDPDARKQRYFDDVVEKSAGIICHTCGQPGHIAKRCTMVVCLMCGAKDDHITPQCPVNKVCYNCNQKGHLNRDCPNARVYRGQQKCDRCGSTNHYQNNCPLLWRTYTYLSEAERDEVLEQRVLKRSLGLGGEGGEGFIAMDIFCYNCAARGHLGDDCPQGGRKADRTRDPSAHSAYNQQFGPFASSSSSEPRAAKRLRHRSRSPNAKVYVLPEGKRQPGKDGREAAKRRAEAQEAKRSTQDDEDDWFSRRAPNGHTKDNDKPKHRERDRDRNGRRHKERDDDRHRDHDRARGGRERDRDRDRDRGANAKRDGRGGGLAARFGPKFQGGYS